MVHSRYNAYAFTSIWQAGHGKQWIGYASSCEGSHGVITTIRLINLLSQDAFFCHDSLALMISIKDIHVASGPTKRGIEVGHPTRDGRIVACNLGAVWFQRAAREITKIEAAFQRAADFSNESTVLTGDEDRVEDKHYGQRVERAFSAQGPHLLDRQHSQIEHIIPAVRNLTSQAQQALGALISN
ncbi:hypothetical protein P153DRAFT_412564 [Dothidotthia symphoricarpi CBS 119687]|uniref:Uncharacterized protein n=1 Tax=Dothidotthia symphoricarpi CBS 119687 TaxID=1392245 RepID=A0A6A5ZVS1_9PLEO|nr:uncharacterized protein P153DRAFT_412564 [Dothidotthia symphoricarpi CBS 119687]KAF2123690.1 hypothetical protein P153DRAFT_412564 [Dothidotthia symphoricarpi CBS 119687]